MCHVILGAMSNKGMARAKCNDSDDHEEGDGRNHADRKRKRDWCGDPVLGHAAGGAGGRADPRGCPSRAILRAHYNSRLTYRHSRGRERGDEDHQPETIKLTSGIEKCVTGILRLCVRTSNRNVISNEVLSTLNILHPPLGLLWSPLELNLDKHLAEGLWRVVQNVDGLTQINDEGWSGILGLAEWCATRGGLRSSDPNQNAGSLAEDDPSLQTFRSLHLILHAAELKNALRIERWPQIVRSVRCLVEAGERGQCPKLR